MTVKYINPVADCLTTAQTYGLSADLNRQIVVGLVINKIVDCDVFMRLVGEALLALRPQITLKSFETGTITFADSELMDRVARECDAAVCAIGHCGSCTAGTVKDGIALVERGCPAVTLVTEIFWDQATALGRSLGWPDAPRVQLPYPIWGSGTESMRSAAKRAAIDLLPLLETADVDAT